LGSEVKTTFIKDIRCVPLSQQNRSRTLFYVGPKWRFETNSLESQYTPIFSLKIAKEQGFQIEAKDQRLDASLERRGFITGNELPNR